LTLTTHKALCLNTQQQEIYDVIKTGENVAVIASEGGTGKSYLLKKLQEDFSADTLFLSTTGVSAIAIGGMTMHRAMSLPLGFPTPEDLRKVSSLTSKLFSGNAVKRIVIDESGMVNTHMWYTFIRRLVRFNKKARGRTARDIQVVLFGDLLQLGSITMGIDLDVAIENFGTEKFFKMQEFIDTSFKFMNLNTVIRQTDVEMKKHLSNIRKGRNLEEAVDYFNNRCYKFQAPLPNDATIITTTNAKVDSYNGRVFQANRNPCAVYTASITGHFDEKSYPCERELRVKVGLRVMTLRNDKEDRWVNGSTGEITRVTGQGVIMRFDHNGKTELVEPIIYQQHKYDTAINEESGEEEVIRVVEAEFEQIPIRQCSAMTGFKAQGATIEKAILDFGSGSGWAKGLTYVMLSRLTSTEGMYFKRRLRVADVAVCQETLAWLDSHGMV